MHVIRPGLCENANFDSVGLVWALDSISNQLPVMPKLLIRSADHMGLLIVFLIKYKYLTCRQDPL